ncbi:MAG: ATP synthase subunit I [Eubacteriales bacterium]|nr:ATP synthase subunit I [Eubacteriales bacterium]
MREKRNRVVMDLAKEAKNMIKAVVLISLLCILGSIIYYRSLEFLPFLFGTVLGAASSIAKVFLLDRTVKRITSMGAQKANNYAVAQQMLRLVLIVVVLLIDALVEQVSLWGVIAGVLAYNLAVYYASYKLGKQKVDLSK